VINFHEFEVVSFGCIGTLVDWHKGFLNTIRPLFTHQGMVMGDQRIINSFIGYEAALMKDQYLPYQEVFKKVLQKMGQDNGFVPTYAEMAAITNAIKAWTLFPDVVESLKILKKQYKLAVITNLDNELLEGLLPQLPIEFDWVITAEASQSYKPSHRIFEYAAREIGVDPSKILHVGHSLNHDVAPVKALKMASVWVNRNIPQKGDGGETSTATIEPDLEVPDLKTFTGFTS